MELRELVGILCLVLAIGVTAAGLWAARYYAPARAYRRRLVGERRALRQARADGALVAPDADRRAIDERLARPQPAGPALAYAQTRGPERRKWQVTRPILALRRIRGPKRRAGR